MWWHGGVLRFVVRRFGWNMITLPIPSGMQDALLRTHGGAARYNLARAEKHALPVTPIAATGAVVETIRKHRFLIMFHILFCKERISCRC